MNNELDLTNFNKGLFLKRDGAWLHDGDLVRHERLSLLLHRCIKRKDTGELGVTTGRDWLTFESEDAPLRVMSVQNLHGQQLELSLSNDTRFLLAPADHALIIDQHDQWRTAIADQQLWARWTRNALQSILPIVQQVDDTYTLQLEPKVSIFQCSSKINWQGIPGRS